MLSTTFGAAVYGVSATLITVEISVLKGLGYRYSNSIKVKFYTKIRIFILKIVNSLLRRVSIIYIQILYLYRAKSRKRLLLYILI